MASECDDFHMCGSCREVFNNVDTFIEHKRKCKVKKTAAELTPKNDKNVNTNDGTPILTKILKTKANRAKTRSQSNLINTKSIDSLEPIQLTDESDDNANSSLFHNQPLNEENESNDDIGQANDFSEILGDEDSDSLYELLTKKEKVIPGIHKLTTNTGTDILYSHQMADNGRKYKCEFNPICNFASYYLKDLERHYRIHTGEKPYNCPQCERSFNRSDKLKLHERSHTGEKPYKCENCPYASSDRSSLVKHIRTHTDERPFKCQICPYASRNSSQLVVHLRTHTGDAPFRCSKCTAAFKINSDLKRHLRMHSGEKPFACEQCDYRSAIKGNLRNHIKLNHSGDKHLNCDHCEFVASSRKSLKEHSREHNAKALRCDYCSYTTSSRSALNNHTRIHTNEKPYECSICGYSCRQACNLRTHIKKKHPDYEIGSVKKRRKIKEQIIENANAKKTVRVKGRAYCQTIFPCHLCDCSFVREDSLRSHIRHHQDINPQAEGAALAILQLQHDPNVSEGDIAVANVIAHEELIDTQPQDAEFEVSTSEVNSQESVTILSSNENTVSVQSQLYHKLMECHTIQHQSEGNAQISISSSSKRGRPQKKSPQIQVTQRKVMPQGQHHSLRIVASHNSSGQLVYQLPPGMRVIPVAPLNQSNNTVLIINSNQSIDTNDSISNAHIVPN